MNILRKIFKTVLLLIIVFVIGFAGLIVYAVISDYKPGEHVVIGVNESPYAIADSSELTLLTWNIGYCGLDKEMDFFYDGGSKVFTPKENCLKNLSAVVSFLKDNDSIDFVFLQEVDKKSKRSYKINEYDTITADLKTYSGYFAVNYDVFFVPLPPASPMGSVLSGIATFSKFSPLSATRYAFPGEYGFPKQLFMLDRCFMANRYPMTNGKELIIINTHNEAFDPGEIRKAQMEFLKSFVLNEYQKGNYVIAGGDWNQAPPDFAPEFSGNQVNKEQMVLSNNFLPADWKWVYDNKTPSNRSVVTAYDPAITPTTVIDFFLLSPNIKAISVRCINLNFENSDHNPVIIKVKIQ